MDGIELSSLTLISLFPFPPFLIFLASEVKKKKEKERKKEKEKEKEEEFQSG